MKRSIIMSRYNFSGIIRVIEYATIMFSSLNTGEVDI